MSSDSTQKKQKYVFVRHCEMPTITPESAIAQLHNRVLLEPRVAYGYPFASASLELAQCMPALYRKLMLVGKTNIQMTDSINLISIEDSILQWEKPIVYDV